MNFRSLGFFILVFFTPLAQAQSSCLPTQNALQVFEVLSPGQNVKKAYPLYAGMEHRPWLEAILEVNRHDKNDVHLTFQFEERFRGVSLPYNLYAVLVLSQGAVVAWLDFTNECLSPGISFFPGQEIEIPVGNLPPLESPHSLQVMVWGRM